MRRHCAGSMPKRWWRFELVEAATGERPVVKALFDRFDRLRLFALLLWALPFAVLLPLGAFWLLASGDRCPGGWQR